MIHKKPLLGFKRILLASLLGTFVIYLFGLPYMYIVLNYITGAELGFLTILKIGCLIFIPGDLMKAVVASFVASKLIHRL